MELIKKVMRSSTLATWCDIRQKKGNLLYEYRDGSNFSGHVETMIKSLVIYNSYNLCLRFDALLVCFKMQDWKMVLSFVVVFSAQCPFVF